MIITKINGEQVTVESGNNIICEGEFYTIISSKDDHSKLIAHPVLGNPSKCDYDLSELDGKIESVITEALY